ncbi:hypothetical protein SAMN00777080_4817 [Aquiflexum balticum DSM 16537]|uniref:Uncharacterized protein n=1 Tax=Aquiflexum balticum DSM 16537 TaxID=758820 RepID=A0A1W2HBA3_9BACT|nr:hypothetical protein [Aquiflexum balticum]SMD46137.1 hypothetical protein SAMN00777080_4817 [Aquiflexum balticum DSM 16537]
MNTLTLKLLKIGIILSYCLIPLIGPKIWITMSGYIFLCLISMEIELVSLGLVLLACLVLMTVTLFGFFEKYWLKIFLYAGIILSIPIWRAMIHSFNEGKHPLDYRFYVVSFLFYTLLIILLIGLYKKKSISISQS